MKWGLQLIHNLYRVVNVTTKRLNNHIEIIIEDSGYGIPDDMMDNLFNPFFTSKSSGLGFGLQCFKNVVEAHDGKIHIDSKVNKGTRVVLQLPVIQYRD